SRPSRSWSRRRDGSRSGSQGPSRRPGSPWRNGACDGRPEAGQRRLTAALPEPKVLDAIRIERLMRLRGIGRWTAEYVLLRGLGRLQIFPGDDVGAHNKLRRFFDLDTELH